MKAGMMRPGMKREMHGMQSMPGMRGMRGGRSGRYSEGADMAMSLISDAGSAGGAFSELFTLGRENGTKKGRDRNVMLYELESEEISVKDINLKSLEESS